MRFAAGYDTIELAIEGRYPESVRDALQSMRDLISADFNEREFRSGWWLGASSKRPGGKNGPAYAFTLQKAGLSVYIARSNEWQIGFCNLLVRFGSVPLTMWGYERCRRELNDLLTVLDFIPRREILSRIDLALDICDLSVSDIQDKLKAGHYIARARKIDPNESLRYHIQGSKQTGFSAGKGTMLRMYDKLQEIKVQSPQKEMMMVEHRWHGSKPDHATRLELQIRRDWLNDHGIDSIEDFFAAQSDAVKYFLEKWFVITERKVVRSHGNQARRVVHPIWKCISDRFQLEFSRMWEGPKAPPLTWRRDNRMAVLIGMMESMVVERALEGENALTLMHDLLIEHVTPQLTERADAIEENLRNKRARRDQRETRNEGSNND